VAGDHSVVLVDEDRVDEAEFADAFGDLADLSFRVGPRIAWVGR
jgi:hypothetical protein